MNVVTDNEKIHMALARAVERIYPSREALEEALRSGRRLRIYLGVDPTGPHLHLGHLTNLLVLKRFQELGHEIVFLIGDFTARIGDPTDKLAARQPLTAEQVRENLKTFKKQAARILSFRGENPVRVLFNSKWLGRMSLKDALELLERLTVQQLLERSMFQERIRHEKPIGVREFLYPFLQGYDSVAMEVDMEIGGTDQTFNMLMGRDLLKELKGKEKFVLTTKLLEDSATGKKLMNKSEGGLINLDDEPNDIFGKVMALPDSAIVPVAELSTALSMSDVERVRSCAAGNPRDAKRMVAAAVVETIYSRLAAARAQREFTRVFSERSTPDEVALAHVGVRSMPLVELLAKANLASSKSEARRLVEQGGVRVNGEKKTDPAELISLDVPVLLQVGPRRFSRVVA